MLWDGRERALGKARHIDDKGKLVGQVGPDVLCGLIVFPFDQPLPYQPEHPSGLNAVYVMKLSFWLLLHKTPY